MKLILLGTSGYHPNDLRQTLCLLIPEHGILLDAGTGIYRAGRYLQTPTLDIFLTHAHLDHVIGLTYLFSVLEEHPLERVTVHAEAEKLAAIEEHLFSEALFPKRPPMETEPFSGQVALPGEGRLTYFPLKHHGGSVGFRLDWPGHSLAYVTDTTASVAADYVASIRGVDLLVHECFLPDSQADWAKTTGHSFTTAVAEVAQAADVGRLVLVHLSPLATEADPLNLAAARAIFPKIELGQDRMELEF